MLRNKRWNWLRLILQGQFRNGQAKCPRHWKKTISGKRVLVVGVYIGNRPNVAAQMCEELGQSQCCKVEQRWAGLFSASTIPVLANCTFMVLDQPVDKFEIINRLLEGVNLSSYDHLLVVDDDAWLQHGFLDAYLASVEHCGFSLAQPARTLHSYYDHRFTLARPWLMARQTRFVEIGPVFSVQRDVFSDLLPFDTSFPMGWGLDYRWGALMWECRMGIVDGVPVDHSYRPQAKTYSRGDTLRRMNERLAQVAHLRMDEAKVVLGRYWRLISG